jgi:hypothetical protein
MQGFSVFKHLEIKLTSVLYGKVLFLQHRFVTKLPTLLYASLQLSGEMVLQRKGKVNTKQINTFLKSRKGKAMPLQAWTGPEGSSSLRLPDFKKIGA